MYKKTEQTCLKNIVPSAGTGVRISLAKSSRVFVCEGGRATLDTSSAARSEAHRAVGSCAECSTVRVVELRVLVSESTIARGSRAECSNMLQGKTVNSARENG